MFSLRLALKYLLPKKKSLTTALISLLSLTVISLVVWLVVVFLSVTAGIEKSWLTKLTTVHGPIRIYPTKSYYNSYYYQIDAQSANSSYSHKTIEEKLQSRVVNPYKRDIDPELPRHFPQNKDQDLVQKLYQVLEELALQIPHFHYQDYELSGAMLRLFPSCAQSSLQRKTMITQLSYLVSSPEKNPYFHHLLQAPTTTDLNHLLFQLKQSRNLAAIKSFFFHIDLESVYVFSKKCISIAALSEGNYP